MNERDHLAEQFEQARPHLRAVAYRMLGSTSEAEDAVQEAWFRLARSDADAIENLRGWLTTVVGRVCLDLLRARREEPSDSLPEPIVIETEGDPEHEALMAESVGLALLVVLETLSPAERLAFVLHDMFAVPFSEIAEILDRSPDSARQLASRARRRVRGARPVAEKDLARQREVVDAFLAASRAGDFERLVAVLDPEVEFHVDIGPPRERVAVGAETVAQRVLARGSRFAPFGRFAIVNGGPGVLVAPPGKRPMAVVGLTVAEGRISAIEVVADPAKLRRLGVSQSD
ncbi:MAG: sigma-70 family RNA polymerase sigma factor [Actinobacteria bacterium]|nr:MAG: sigma-70 family RNA polymerase sigma factor [Actinomycetota bacterium]